jgi:membrane protein DedA with SNARE-associated domain
VNGLLSHGSAPWLYTIIFVIVLAEAIILVGTFIPTFSTLVAAGALASHGTLNLPLVVVVAATAVVIGDRLGHLSGRAATTQVPCAIQARPRWASAWTRTHRLMTRHGHRAVFVGRFIPVVRTIAPHLTGRAGIPYRQLLPYSATAALLWAGAEAGLGFAAATGATFWPL